jgi:eukaryotic-like serine/threonine-protein kinase
MGLSAGTRLGSYEILSALGAGGMGEVYRARDTKLKRDVAIKVLLSAVLNDRDRLVRFEREAELLASLNHPNIAAIYGLEDVDGVKALVLELVEGLTLADRIAQGPILLDEALPIAKQIVEALEAAHEQGIIHRDLKPANIKIRSDGTVKVLDFGLAKAIEGTGGAGRAGKAGGEVLTQSPTITSPAMTQAGMILGTAAYMSPEQATGRAVDKRADIWAFGVVLYEMLTGVTLFAGETMSHTLAAILRDDVDFSRVPPRVRRLIASCLERDPKKRLRDIADAWRLLDETPVAVTVPARRSGAIAWGLAGAAVVVAAAAGWLLRPAMPAPTTRLSIALAPGEQVTTVPAIARDGQLIAYAAGRTPATSQLYLRTLNDFSPRAVAGSFGAQYPFFSPDDRTIAFFAGGKVQRAPVGGGAATVIASAPAPWGGTWTDDDRIVYVPSFTAGMWRVSANGGAPEQLTQPDGADAGYAHVFPHRLTKTGDVLFSFWGRAFHMAVLPAGTSAWHSATPDKRSFEVGIYAESGHLLVSDGAGGVRAAAWSPAATAVVRPDTVVLENVNWVAGAEAQWLAVAANGTAVYAPGSASRRHLVWADRQGNVTQITGAPSQIAAATVSHDGRRVAYNGYDGALWLADLTTGARTRILADQTIGTSVWLPGDDRIVLSSNVSGDWEIYTVGANGPSDVTPLVKKPFTQHPQDVTPDGTVVYMERHPVTGSDLWTVTPDGKTSPLVVTPFNETSARVSSDGRYVAYVSDESGRNEVYALPMSGKGGRVAISIEGGTGPVWSRDGRELFYRAGDDLMSVQVKTTPSLVVGERRKLLDMAAYDSGYFHEFDVSADGQRFLLMQTEPDARPTRLNVVLNWSEELKQRVSVK